MFNEKREKKIPLQKRKSIIFLLFKRSKPIASKSWIVSPRPSQKAPPLQSLPFIPGNHEERTSPNTSEFLQVKVKFVGTLVGSQNNAYNSSIFSALHFVGDTKGILILSCVH
jgi:hypothetical protein